VEAQASGDLADLAGVNAAEKRPVAGSRIFSGKRAHVYEAIYGASGCTFCTGYHYGSSMWSARGRGSLRSTY